MIRITSTATPINKPTASVPAATRSVSEASRCSSLPLIDRKLSRIDSIL